MKILALTPHPCNIQDDNGVIHVADRIETEPGRFLVLRADTIINSTKAVGNFTAKSKSFGKPVWVTVDKDGKNEEIFEMNLATKKHFLDADIIIVSLIALQAVKQHGTPNHMNNSRFANHCYAPGDLLRENGQPTGCVGLTFIS
jgi:hypothetical protein